MFSTIIHPTDLSEASIPALQSAHELAKQLNSKLLICFIAHTPLVAAGTSLTDPESNETRNIAEELESYQSDDPALERELRIVVTEKSTSVKTLLKFLEEMHCDLLVMGMHRRTGVAGWLHPSITEEVVRRAGCAVLVVKQHDSEYVFEETN
jgi:universal stress protein A